jgi:8-oxo-dGTP pyrophosphatase MutT (NUDIX family)
MIMMILEMLKQYQPKNEQEQVDKQVIIDFIQRNHDFLDRDNLAAHFSSSAIVVNEMMDKVLFAYHNIYDSWGWVGGHNDGHPDPLKVAIQEAKEETGIEHVRPYSEDIFMVDVIYVSNHIKHGKYVNDHLHLNVTFLLIADEQQTLSIKPDENSGVAWFTLEEVFDKITEPRMVPIYQKAFNEIKRLKKQKG